MDLVIVIATMSPEGDPLPDPVATLQSSAMKSRHQFVVYNTPSNNRGVMGSYDLGYRNTSEDLLAYIHNDVSVHERGWDQRVLNEFEDPTVGLVGFGGALRHGHPDLYKVPYRLQQLARDGYLSNVDDAEVHGERFTGSRDVAVLDGFALVVRRVLLDKCGGWSGLDLPPMHNYDYYASGMAHRHGYRVRLVGVRCQHWGGRTGTSSSYQEWASKTKWGSDAAMHEAGHRLIYDEFRSVLPWRCR